MTHSQSELSNWAVVSYKDDTGLGRMAEDARRVLGFGFHVVVPSRRLQTKPLDGGDFLLTNNSDDVLRDFLAARDGILMLEKADWSANLVPIAKRLGLPVAAVPMWEWFRAEDPLWRLCDLLICPNRKCFDVVTAAGYRNAVQLPWALDLARFSKREICGPARAFIHNAGLVDADDRKSTRDVIEAFQHVKCPEARLLVRLQATAELPKPDHRTEVRIGNVGEPGELWNTGDVAVQPSKLEGIGFTVLEPICAGMPVITLDAAPMNEYRAGFYVRPRWLKRRAFASQWVPQAHLRLPRRRHLAALMEMATQIDLGDISRQQRAWAEEVFDPDGLQSVWTRALAPLARRREVCA